MKKKLHLLIIFTLTCNLIFAQKGVVEASSRGDLLKNLTMGVAYLSPEFKKGTIFFKKGLEIETILNICIVDNSIRYISSNDTLLLSNKDEVLKILVDSSLYFNTGKYFARGLMLNGNTYICERKILVLNEPAIVNNLGHLPATSSARNISTKQVGNTSEYGTISKVAYEVKITYLLVNNEGVYPANKRIFRKLFPQKSKEISKFINEHNLDLDHKDDLLSLFTFCASE